MRGLLSDTSQWADPRVAVFGVFQCGNCRNCHSVVPLRYRSYRNQSKIICLFIILRKMLWLSSQSANFLLCYGSFGFHIHFPFDGSRIEVGIRLVITHGSDQIHCGPPNTVFLTIKRVNAVLLVRQQFFGRLRTQACLHKGSAVGVVEKLTWLVWHWPQSRIVKIDDAALADTPS